MYIELKRITKCNDYYLEEIKNIYETSFPPEEKVDFELIKKSVYQESDFHVDSILYNNFLAGFITYLKINNFNFDSNNIHNSNIHNNNNNNNNFSTCIVGCYFAIKNTLRNENIGSAAIKIFQQQNPKSIIVGEIEHPINKNAQRRLEFYRRNGFIIKDYGYLQPPISPANTPLPLLIISYPFELSLKEYQQVRKILYEKVYHADINLYI